MIVEAMKTMNHVPSTNDGVVKRFRRWSAFELVNIDLLNNLNVQKVLIANRGEIA